MPSSPVSVARAVEVAKATLNGMGTFRVVGEVSGFRGPNARSGHCYFDLKDEEASMSVIVWRSTFAKLDFELKDGLEVELSGSFDVYVRSGRMSFIASKVEATGEGALRQRVAALAKKLAAEGLMDEAAKLRVPAFCERVCVVTSLSGSVKDDVVRTLARRNRLVEIVLCSCSVQGADAPPTIIAALKAAEATAPDAILLVRGGGSLEDLMAFNDERLARTIAALRVPVVTGIGHEPDVTIADLVASRRQSTPTAAAESVAPPMSQLQDALTERSRRLESVLARRMDMARESLSGLAARLPLSLAQGVRQRRDLLTALASSRAMRDPALLIFDRARDLDRAEERIADALPRGLARQAELLERLAGRAELGAKRVVERASSRLSALGASLTALSPLAVLGRGYAIVKDERGHVVSRASAVGVGARITAILGEGSLEAEVTRARAPETPPFASTKRPRSHHVRCRKDEP